MTRTFVVNKIRYSKFVTVDAEIIDISSWGAEGGDFHITYEFELEEKTYNASIGVQSSHEEVGKFEEIRINPNKPTEIEDKRTTNASLFFAIFCGGILIFFIVGLCVERANRLRDL